MGDNKNLEEKLTNAFLEGLFPKPGTEMTLETFKTRYHISQRTINRVTRNSVAVSMDLLLSKKPELLERIIDLQAEPLAKTKKLTRFLENETYTPGKKPGHLLIQNLIASLSLEQKAAEALTKTLGQLATSEIAEIAASEGFLTEADAIQILAKLEKEALVKTDPKALLDTGIKDLSDMAEEIKADPLVPEVSASITSSTRANFLERESAVSEYDKLRDGEKPKILPPPTILPL
jgi:hypothetical protein